MANEPEEDDLDATLEQATETAVNRMVDFTFALQAIKVPEKLGWFRTMLVGILTATHSNYSAAQAVMPAMHAFSCWGARNLLELRVITAYVLESPENATDFMDDLGADVRQFWEAMRKAQEFTFKENIADKRALAAERPEPLRATLMAEIDEEEKAGPDTSGPDAGLEEVRKVTIALGGDMNRNPKMASKIAELAEESARYAPRYKFLSKVVHPTALFIAQGVSPGGIDPVMPSVRNQATTDMLTISNSIQNHVKAHGIGWPKEL